MIREVCRRCGHNLWDHHHYRSKWERVVDTQVAVDQGMKKKWETAKNAKDKTTVLIDAVERALDQLSEIIDHVTNDLLRLADDYSHLSLSGSFSGQMEKAAWLLEQSYKNMEKNGLGQTHLQKVKDGLDVLKKKKEELLNDAKMTVPKESDVIGGPTMKGLRYVNSNIQIGPQSTGLTFKQKDTNDLSLNLVHSVNPPVSFHLSGTWCSCSCYDIRLSSDFKRTSNMPDQLPKVSPDFIYQDAKDKTAATKYDLSPNLVNSVAQQQELVRFLTAVGFSSDPEGKFFYFLFTNEQSSIFSRHWNGSGFGQEDPIANSVRPDSSAAYIITNNERFVFCISHDSSFRVLKYDDHWLHLKNMPRYVVHPKGQMAGYVGLDGKRYALFQDASRRLISLDETWTQTILPVQAAIGTPIAHIILGVPDRPRLLVFYLGKDSRLHYLEQRIGGIWGSEFLFTDVLFEDKLNKMVVTWNESKRKLEVYVLTGKKGVFQATQGGRGEGLSLGKIEDEKFIPGTDAEFVDFNLSGQRNGSWSWSWYGPPSAPTQFASPFSGQGRFQPRLVLPSILLPDTESSLAFHPPTASPSFNVWHRRPTGSLLRKEAPR